MVINNYVQTDMVLDTTSEVPDDSFNSFLSNSKILHKHSETAGSTTFPSVGDVSGQFSGKLSQFSLVELSGFISLLFGNTSFSFSDSLFRLFADSRVLTKTFFV